jgi:GT2 family glycosyltransferase
VIAVVVLTHDRVSLLRRCVQNVLLRTSELTAEIVIWDNASADGTGDFLDGVADPRIRTVRHGENIAMNALPRAIALTRAPYIVELDDDVVDAPARWDETLLHAYRRLPEIGFLCASIAYDPADPASRYLRFMREEAGAYTEDEVDGIRLLRGSVGGACTMTSRELYERVGGFREHRRYPYWRPDVPYQRAIRRLGFDSAFLADLEVRHEGGRNSSGTPRPKAEFWEHETRARARKDRVKRALLALPLVARLNRRRGWFDPPAPSYDPDAPGPREEPPRPPTPAS